jgi:tetratricopeptide (TPR) repeat protein
MKLGTILPLILLAMRTALPGQDAESRLRLGDDALAAGLWEIAALHFNECLAAPGLAPADKSRVAIRLAEAWIRDGKAADALALLEESFAAPHPEAPFWKGLALAGLGRFADAVGVLAPVLENPAAMHRREAGFTIESLQLALGKPDAALEALGQLASSPDIALTARARLHQVEILLDLGRTKEARETMPEAANISPENRATAAFLEGHLLLAEGRPAEAAAVFQSLVDPSQGQSLRHPHLAAVGLADAFLARKDAGAAAAFLLAFIQDHPDSPQLEALFQRLENALPEKPVTTDPVLERLAQWITPPEIPATGPVASGESTAAAAWPTATASSGLLVHSLFTRATALMRISTPEARAEAMRLLNRLRIESPDHPLTDRALLLTARRALDDGETERALGILATLRENATIPETRGVAAFLEARSARDRGDRKQAALLFDEAANSLSENNAKNARLNAAILRLADGGVMPVLLPDKPADSRLAADLALERALSLSDPTEKRKAIEEFLTRHPEHPRVPEARLAAAEAALAGPQPDLSFARSQADTLAVAVAEKSAGIDPARLALLRLRIGDLSNDSAAAIATARQIIEQHPGEPAAEAALVLGRGLFQSRSYNDARLVLEKLAATDTNPARAEAAWLLSARSAALVPTSQSRQEALILFDKAISLKGPLAAVAMLEKARLMIDINRLAEAAGFLREWFDSLKESDPLHLPAGLLLGEAIYARGSVNPGSLNESLAVYDRLLAHAERQPALFNRLQYLRGRTLEQIPDEKDPSRKRERQAFIAYYSVLETAGPPAEWHYFELCGFRALALLEKAGRWPAAIACARKIASFNGPRAAEAASRASQIQLKHMIWED